MSKQDRQGARTPADVERRFGGTLNDVSGVAADAQKRAENAEQEVERLKYMKITVDQLDIDGEELNIKVAATNITGKLTAEKINAKGLDVKEATIGGWALGEVSITYHTTIDSQFVEKTETVSALVSGWETVTLTTEEGFNEYKCRTYLTPFAVYIEYGYNVENASTIIVRKSWFDLVVGQETDFIT